jgi:prepilin-type N-terminal cleavage/methylation domain-containing protein
MENNMKINLFKKNINRNLDKGFTLLEVLVAVFMLTVALASLLTIVTDSLFAAKYANNQLTATYLAQEAIDFIRNDRDTTAFQNDNWSAFVYHYGDPSAPSMCYTPEGCSFDVTDWSFSDMVYCDPGLITTFGTITCPQFFMETNLPTTSFYHHNSTSPNAIIVPFKRQIKLQLANSDEEMRISVTIEWMNGSMTKSETLNASLLKWQ